MPTKLQARPWRKVDGAADSKRHQGELGPLTGSAPGTACRLGMLKADGGAEEGGDCFSGDSTALAEGVLKSQRQEGKQQSRNHKVQYLLVDGDVLSSLQRPEDTAAARRSFPLAELLEVHAKPTEALDVAASAGRGRGRAWRDNFRGARQR